MSRIGIGILLVVVDIAVRIRGIVVTVVESAVALLSSDTNTILQLLLRILIASIRILFLLRKDSRDLAKSLGDWRSLNAHTIGFSHLLIDGPREWRTQIAKRHLPFPTTDQR